MTQEEKQLLLKDLCARLPYRVMIDVFPYADPQFLCMIDPIRFEYRLDFGSNKSIFHRNLVGEEVSDIKPYLRPMSSMTSEELKEFAQFTCLSMHRFICSVTNTGHWYNTYEEEDWLNAHHFDFRNLIGKGLALEAPDGMYK